MYRSDMCNISIWNKAKIQRIILLCFICIAVSASPVPRWPCFRHVPCRNHVWQYATNTERFYDGPQQELLAERSSSLFRHFVNYIIIKIKINCHSGPCG